MTISKQELVEGIRFAGRRAAAALEHVPDFDRQLAQEWTTADAFRHIAAGAGALEGFYGGLGTGALESFSNDDAASGNARTVERMAEVSREELGTMILEGSEKSAAFAETLDEDDLATVVTLGDYRMPKSELVAQIWIHHPIHHAYEGSQRWPL